MLIRFGFVAAVAVASLAAAQTPPVQGGASGRPNLPADHQQQNRATTRATNKAALASPRPNTLTPADLTNSTADAGGGAAVDKAPVHKGMAKKPVTKRPQ